MHIDGIITLCGQTAALASFAVSHALPTGLSTPHNAVSQYGTTPYRAG